MTCINHIFTCYITSWTAQLLNLSQLQHPSQHFVFKHCSLMALHALQVLSYKTVCNYSQRYHYSCYTLNYLLFRKNEQNLTENQNGHHLSMKQNYHQWFINDFDQGTELKCLNLYEIRPYLFSLYKTLSVNYSPNYFKPHTSEHLYT